jgi:DNA repair protein RadC
MESNNVSIKNWSDEDRPREKLVIKGIAYLSDAELLTILIGTGTKNKSALDLANEIIKLVKGNLHELGRLSIKQLMQIKGIGLAKAITIAAALEMGRRRQLSEALIKPQLMNSRHCFEVLQPLMSDLLQEAFYVLFLNHNNRLMHAKKISNGSSTATVVDIKLILKEALDAHANTLVISHNHPSGNLQPSEADKALTHKIKDAAALMEIRLVDHIIIAGTTYFSFADEGLL